MEQFEKISVQASASPQYQVCEQFRHMILSGELKPGEKLPATSEIAKASGVNVTTVHGALAMLTKEGLLVRNRRSGTFVRGRALKLNSVGVYFPYDPWGVEEYSSKRAVVKALKDLGASRDIRMSHWIDPRPIAEQDEPWSELVSAVQRAEIDALIVPLVDWPHLNWLDKLQIPRVFASSASRANCLWVDVSEFVRLSIQATVEQGARSVGLISPQGAEATQPDGSPHPFQEFFLEFVQEAKRCGLEIHSHWIVGGKDDEGSYNQKAWGYRKMHEFWAQPTHPEALVVYPDVAAEGVLMALYELGIHVPNDLKVVFHKNEEVPFLCPIPAEFVTCSLSAVARKLLDAVEAQFYGRPHLLEPIGFRRQGSPDATEKQHGTKTVK